MSLTIHAAPPITDRLPRLSEAAVLGVADPTDPLVSLREAVELRYGAYSTLRRYIAEGILPALRVGPRSIRVRLSDLEALGTPAAGRPSNQAVIDAAINKLVSEAPKLTSGQIHRLASLLGAVA